MAAAHHDLFHATTDREFAEAFALFHARDGDNPGVRRANAGEPEYTTFYPDLATFQPCDPGTSGRRVKLREFIRSSANQRREMFEFYKSRASDVNLLRDREVEIHSMS